MEASEQVAAMALDPNPGSFAVGRKVDLQAERGVRWLGGAYHPRK